MTITMYDAVTVGNIPGGAKYVAGYVDGMFQNVGELRSRFPNAKILTITVSGGIAAACDCETGDLTVAQAVAWVERRLAAGEWRPCVYADEDTWVNQGLEGQLRRYGTRIRRWMAKYDNVDAVPPGYDAKQYRTGDLDTSVCLDDFFGPPPKPKPDYHYDWFYPGPFKFGKRRFDERTTVETYDRVRKTYGPRNARVLVLRARLKLLASRVWTVAHASRAKGKPSWDRYHRGWRFQQLSARADGRRIV